MKKPVSPQDKEFLEALGFAEYKPEDEDEAEKEYDCFYSKTMQNHPYLGDLLISVWLNDGKIEVDGNRDLIIEKPFTHENLLGILEFLRLPLNP